MKKRFHLQIMIACMTLGLVFMTAEKGKAQATISSKTDVTCFGAKDGTATVTVIGGTAPYTYQWTPAGGNGATATGLSGGTFTVKVLDANDCEVSASVEITEPPEINVEASASGAIIQNCPGPTNSEVTLTAHASGGAPPYSYSWPGGTKRTDASGEHSVTVTDQKGCSKVATVNVLLIPILCSIDPNDIAGPNGYDTLHWISKEEIMSFKIRYENDPEFATAPAQKVTVNQKVDPNLNIFSFRLSDFGFGDFDFQVPPNTTFYTKRLDVRDSLGIFVDVLAGIDVIKNELFWIFESIDPMTGYSPVDARIGFLPVNDTIRRLGEGYATYTILPGKAVTSGDTIHAIASIVFDVNEAIETNLWVNTIDALPPTSFVVDNFSNYSDTTSIPITFGGSDDPHGTGIASYRLFYSKNKGPWTLYQEFSADTAATFTASSGYYRFYSIAVDHVGNIEPSKSTPDADITIIDNLKFAIEGVLNYANFNASPLSGSTIYLKSPGGEILDSTTTDLSGKFVLEKISSGLYVTDARTTKPWGGVNATDALMINRAAIQLITLDSLQEKVADVNASASISATDALLTLRRSLGLDNSFAAGDWFHLTDTLMVEGDTVYDHRMTGLCFGDVNKSYQPSGARLFRSVTPEYEGVIEVSGHEFLYPLYLQQGGITGAISLTLQYPADQVEIIGINFKGKDMLFNDLGGILQLGWQSIDGEKFLPDEQLLAIHMKRLPALMEKDVLQPKLLEPSELADIRAEVLYGSRIAMPQVQFSKAIPENFAAISNYPNPCTNQTTLTYQLPERGKTEIRLFNTLGELVMLVKPGELEPGEHTHQLSLNECATGVYHYTLKVYGKTQDYSASGRFVIGSK